MTLYTNRSIVSLLNMTAEMYRKGIENSRIIKTACLILRSGVSPSCISPEIIQYSVENQREDGGYIGNGDTMFNALFLSHYFEFKSLAERALTWIQNNANENGGWGRTQRDISRIPVTGLLLYFCPQLARPKHLHWLEKTWKNEPNSLTYKAAYALAAFEKNMYKPKDKNVIANMTDWLSTQQESDGGFAPWKNHPVGTDIVCTSIATLGLLAYGKEMYRDNIFAAYRYMKDTQLPSGIWAYHEIEDGASWGLYAMTQIEECFGDDYLNKQNGKYSGNLSLPK